MEKGPVWADPPISPSFQPRWNQKDGKINRKSFVKDYQIVDGKPLNPIGRTGMCGRGLLGRRWTAERTAERTAEKTAVRTIERTAV